jgi:hypothetical protein
MIEPRYLELIHGEIDGCNTTAERAELREVLASHPEAARLFRELTQLAQTLDRVEEVDPPPALKANILARLDPQVGTARQERWSLLRPPRERWLRYAYVAVGGLVLGVLLHHFAFDRGPRDLSPWLTGTMARTEDTAATGSTWTIDVAAVRGTVHLVRHQSLTGILVDLTARTPIEIVLEYDRDEAGFRGLVQEPDGPVVTLHRRQDRIILEGTGTHNYTILMQHEGKAGTAVRLTAYEAGDLLCEGSLPLTQPG